ncbi:MAG: M23 family metallopeptidase, partial [Oscillospiraceae bacterium]
MWGTQVKVTHPNEYVSVYSNLKVDVNVKKGQEIKIGEVIGAVGDTAKIEQAEEEHLHLDVIKNKNFIDPLSLLDK